MRHRRAGLALVATGAAVVVVSTFLPWVDFRGFTISLWDLTGAEVVVLAASGFVATTLALLALVRGGREVAVAAAGAVVAGIVLAILGDVRAAPEAVRGVGDRVAAVGAGLALAGVIVVALSADAPRPRAMRGAAALLAVAIALVVGENALQVHPEIQVVR